MSALPSARLPQPPGEFAHPQYPPAADLADLADRGEEIRAQLLRLTSVPADTRTRQVTLVARGRAQAEAALASLARGTRTSVVNATPRDRFDATGQTTALNALAYRRGVVMDRIVNEVTCQQYPLLPLTSMHTRQLVVAPVRMGMIVTDHSRLVFPGPRLETGEGTMWTTRDREILETVTQLLRGLLKAGRRIPTLPVNDTNTRLLEVLTCMVNGLTDTAIAARLSVSVRLVQKDIHALKELAGVGSRIELARALG